MHIVKAPPMVGPTWRRVRLTLGSDCLPVVVPGDHLASLSYSMLHCLLTDVRCPMIQGCTSTSLPLFLIHVRAPEGYTS